METDTNSDHISAELPDLAIEKLPSDLSHEDKKPSQEQLTQLITTALSRMEDGDRDAYFELGQLYFEQGKYEEARQYFTEVADTDVQAQYQLAIMDYDGLAGPEDQARAVESLKQIARAPPTAVHRSLAHAAEYNIGRAYYQGYGVQQSTDEAIRWWLAAAADGDPKGSAMAQTSLGYYYTQESTRDLKKAFYWHTEACGNGSIESQGALGMMYLLGIGVKRNIDTAFYILKESAERGNVYAMGNLVALYYRKKLYTKASELAVKVVSIQDLNKAAEESGCVREYVSKGIAISCFFYGRCLHLGRGVRVDEAEAHNFYSKSFQYDPDVCAHLQTLANRGII